MSRAPKRLGRPERPIVLPVGSQATIVIPSKYPDIFEDCRASLEQFAPKAPKILVRDGSGIAEPAGWTTIQGPEGPFVYARNVNLGIQACSGDVLLMNDDVRFIKNNTLDTLQGSLALLPDVGILSPSVIGDACNVQCIPSLIFQPADLFIAFVCVLIRRSLLDKIGLLDESFIGYGSEDIDLCRRAQDAGFKVGTTSLVTVQHGHRGTKSSTSHDRERALDPDAYSFKPELSDKRYIEKWGRADKRFQ